LIGSGAELVRQYLVECIAVERANYSRLHEFALSAIDDEEVQGLLSGYEDQTARQLELLAARLGALGGGEISHGEGILEATVHLGPNLAESDHIPEERILHSLIATYTAASGDFAAYEALATMAVAAGDPETEVLARQIQAEHKVVAENLWHLLPSRSKIAFNMLTVSEVDPAVETKMADDRLES